MNGSGYSRTLASGMLDYTTHGTPPQLSCCCSAYLSGR